MPLDIRPTRVIELIEDGRFDEVLESMGAAVLRRLKVVKAREERKERLRQRRERAASKRVKQPKKVTR